MKKTTKKLISLLLTLVLALSISSMTAFAEDKFETNIKINDKFVSSSMTSGTGWSYDNSTATLTLDGFNGSLASDWTETNNLKELTIKLTGSNTVDAGESSLTLKYIHNVTFEGTGSLTIKADKVTHSDAAASFFNVTFNGGTINLSTDKNIAIAAESNIVFNGGTLNLSSAQYPLYSNGMLDGKIKLPAGTTIDGAKFYKYDFANDYKIVECPQADAMMIEKAGAFTLSKGGATAEIKVLDSKNTKWTPGSKEGVVFRFDMDIKDFVKLVINGKVVDKKYYTLKEGSTIVTLSNDYLKTLPNGSYEVEAHSTNGVAKASFTVSGNTLSPNTGATTMGLGAIGLGVALLAVLKKKEND